MRSVWIMDTTWDPSDLELREKRFTFLKTLKTKKDIESKIRELSKKKSNDGDFYLVHHSDVLEVSNLLDHLATQDNFILFSGASVGVHDAVLPRSRIAQRLEGFLSHWRDGDEISAKEFLRSARPIGQIDRIRLWIDRAQHDYINLLAPLDLLAIAFVGGEIDTPNYMRLRDQLTQRLSDKSAELLKEQSKNLQNMVKVFEEAKTLFEDPQTRIKPNRLVEDNRLEYLLNAHILHVEDEIDKGWDIVMPAIFGEQYECVTSPDKVLDRVNQLVESEKPFIVLLDLGLKSGDSNIPNAWKGIELLKDIRKQFKAVPILVFSARNDLDSYRRVIEAGANGFIQKPCRVLSSDDDEKLFDRFRSQMIAARFALFRYFLYCAFDLIQTQLKSKTLKLPFQENDDPTWQKRRRNLLFLLDQLVDTDFERGLRDHAYAQIAFRNLILAMCRPFEKVDKASSQEHSEPFSWKRKLLADYRNGCAHTGRGDALALDLRDVMLTTLLIFDPEATGVEQLPREVQDYISKAYDVLFMRTPENALDILLIDAKNGTVPKSQLLKAIRNNLPRSPKDIDESDFPLISLCADKVINNLDKQEVGLHWELPQNTNVQMIQLESHSKSNTSIRTSFINPPKAKETVVPPAPIMTTNRSRAPKGMKDFFRGEGSDLFIDFGKKYLGVKVDGNDPGQCEFFEWYYKKHIETDVCNYTSDLIQFLKETYGLDQYKPIPLEAITLTPNRPIQNFNVDRQRAVEQNMMVSSQALAPNQQKNQNNIQNFELSLFKINDQYQGADPKGDALTAIGKQLPPKFIDDDRKGIIFFKSRGNGKQQLGVKLRLRETTKGANRFLQINPTAIDLDHPEGRGVLLNYKESEDLIKTAVSTLSWINQKGVSNVELEVIGHTPSNIFGNSHSTTIPVPNRLQNYFKGMSLAVVPGTPDVNDAVDSWKNSLSSSGAVFVHTAEEAKAFIVIVPKDSPSMFLEDIRKRYERFNRPWKIVNPSSENKDWNVLVGLYTRFGQSVEPFNPIRARDPNIIFMGLDLGHDQQNGTCVAATLLDHQGRLIAWTQGPNMNGARSDQRAVERISKQSMLKIAHFLLNVGNQRFDWSNMRLVIHRDGETLEDVEAMIEILQDELDIYSIDWLDVNKQRAPLFFVDDKSPIGQFVIFDDRENGPEIWIRTAPGSSKKYSRPLCIVPRTSNTDIETLALEVFDLSNVATQDYEMKAKLPATTYFADGFSATGEKQVRFWGYEHLRISWD